MKTDLDPVFLIALSLLAGLAFGAIKLFERLYRQQGDATPSPAARALEEFARRHAGGLRWDSPYEAVVVGRSGARQVEVRAWLDPGMPLPANEPALRVALFLELPLDLGRRAKVKKLQRGTLDGVTLGRGAQPAIDELLRDVDEVLVSAGRLEARVARVEQALAVVQAPGEVPRLLRQLETLARLLAEHHRPPLQVTATERSARASDAPTCPYCRTPVDDDPEECPACATLHHGECLREHGRCTVLGCRGRPSPRVQERA